MLAKLFHSLTYCTLGAAVSCGIVGESFAQQPPSSRYQPVGYNLSDESIRQNGTPPSVHIPPREAQPLPENISASGGLPNSNSRGQSYGPMPTGASGQQIPDQGAVRQTSFVQEPGKTPEPSVPEILQRTGPNPAPAPSATPMQGAMPPRPTTHVAQPSPSFGLGSPSSPEQYAKQMSQLRQVPSTDQKADQRLAQMKQDYEALQRKAMERQPQVGKTGASLSEPGSSSSAATHQATSGFAAKIPTPIGSAASSEKPLTEGTVPTFNAELTRQSPTSKPSTSNALAAPPSRSEPATLASQRESVQDFMAAAPGSGANAEKPGLKSMTDPKVLPASMQDSENFGNTRSTLGAQAPTSGSPTSGSPASGSPASGSPTANSPTMGAPSAVQDRSNSAIRLTAPSISVESFGPKSIGINKPAVFKVVATNETEHVAERVMVSIDLPQWVEVEKVNMTAGERQMAENKQQSRLMWKIDQIPGQGSQTMTITAVPRKAEAFDLGIEWTIAPRAGTASIQVTQPKLEMAIVGPEEVQFGETAPYEVTVRNAGNGAAENVVVMLSEALNGERGNLGDIPAGGLKTFTVNLFARTPGELELGVSAVADNQAESTATRKLVIRRASLGISISGPSLRYAGTAGEYTIQLSNTGDATAEEVVAALGLPTGVKFLGGLEAFKLIEGGLRWQIGRLEPGQTREYKVTCQLDAAGDVQLEVGTQGKGALQAAHACVTKVQTIADLSMQVEDPPGPLTTGEEITYEITVQNRGTKPAKGVDVFMILSEGMEPKSGSGLEYRIPRDGALQFATIPQLDPGQKMVLKVNAVAFKPGTHVFRAHLVCEEADAREIKEGTSRFFGDEVHNPVGNTAENPNFNNSDFQKNLK